MKNLSLKAKLISAFLAVAFVLAIVAGINLFFTKKVDAEYADVTENLMPSSLHIQGMRVGGLRISRMMPQLGMELSQGRADSAVIEAYEKNLGTYQDSRKKYTALPFFPGEEAAFLKADSAYEKVLPISARLVAIAKTGDKASFPAFEKIYKEEFVPSYAAVQAAFVELMDFQQHLADKSAQEANDLSERAVLVSTILAVVGVILAICMGWFISARLGNDLSRIVARVEESSTQVASAAAQIASSSTELSESSTEQAAAIQETAASVDEVSAMIKKNSENAARSQTASAESKSNAETGSREMAAMTESMTAIAAANERIMRQVEEGNREISEIVKVINDIGSKTKVINDIVFQTKLLSFNASVEAARAGEHGKGFAVVAEEVGNLAQMSGNAAKEITDMLETSVRKVEGIVTRTKEGVAALIADAKQKVESGTRTAEECRSALEGILRAVGSVDQMVGEISYASREQATGMGEITKAMAQLDQATNQNSSVSQQCAAASEQLSGQAQAMAELVQELNELLNGAGAAVAAASASRAKAPQRVAKVIPLQPKAKRAPVAFKAAAGSDLPAADDPRFEDV
jgi:methyl-accepting chemotaxis protein